MQPSLTHPLRHFTRRQPISIETDQATSAVWEIRKSEEKPLSFAAYACIHCFSHLLFGPSKTIRPCSRPLGPHLNLVGEQQAQATGSGGCWPKLRIFRLRLCQPMPKQPKPCRPSPGPKPRRPAAKLGPRQQQPILSRLVPANNLIPVVIT